MEKAGLFIFLWEGCLVLLVRRKTGCPSFARSDTMPGLLFISCALILYCLLGLSSVGATVTAMEYKGGVWQEEGTSRSRLRRGNAEKQIAEVNNRMAFPFPFSHVTRSGSMSFLSWVEKTYSLELVKTA